jgi:hypothetical protein
MKIYKILTLLIFCLFHRGIQAQSTFHVSAGATVTTKGNSVITLSNAKFTNNGTFSGTSGTVNIKGDGSNANTIIEGTGTTTFNNLIINKTANNAQLNQNIAVTGNLTLTSGGVSLSSGNIDFGSTGSLLNETETNRIFGTGGYLQATAVLNVPTNSNPANLGAIITSTVNLGSTVIKRAHSPFVLNGNGMNRSFDIVPANNTGLNATLKFNYLEAELNGNTEANLALWKSTNAGTNFTALPSTNDATNNFVQSTGISSFALFSVGANVAVAAPTGAASQTFCAGKTVADLVTTGTNIKWYDAATAGSVLLSSTVLVNGTTYYATQTVSGVESTNRLAVTATVNALPVLNPSSNSPVCSGQTLFLYAKGEPYSGQPSTDTYTWTGVNNFTANTQNPVIGNVSMSANGIYTVSAVSSANCSATATVMVTVKETPTLVVSNFTNPTPENNPDGTISFTTNLPNSSYSLSYSSTGSPKDVTVSNGAFTLSGLVSGVYGNFAVTNNGCTGRNNTEVTLLSTPFTLVKSITSGNWESSTTWNIGRVPKAGDVVIIDAGHAVTINSNSTIKDMEVRGQLIYSVVGIIINLVL